eukprot:6184531-Lingulodinium_polyedra.AAC.1
MAVYQRHRPARVLPCRFATGWSPCPRMSAAQSILHLTEPSPLSFGRRDRAEVLARDRVLRAR